MTIGKRIKRLRRELDLTQSEFAAMIGSVQNTITGYENDRRNPSSPVISLICREFNVNETWLRTGEGEMFIDESLSRALSFAAEVDCNNLELHFLESYFNLSERERKSFCEILLKMFPNAFTDVQDPLEKFWQEALPLSETTAPAAGNDISVHTSPATEPLAPDIAAELAELKRQNREKDKQLQDLAAKVAAMEEEDRDAQLKADFGAALSALQSGLAGNSKTVKK